MYLDSDVIVIFFIFKFKVLATGLSGLYSLLPRKLPNVAEDWHQFTPEDIRETPELSMFLNSLEFCNAVIQVITLLVFENWHIFY